VAGRIELIYQQSCPNVAATRTALREALRRTGRTPVWTEWERDAPGAPAHARLNGSPTILVDGRDVLGAVPGDGGESCRLYGGGREGVPPVIAIVAALESAGRTRSGWSRALAVMPGTGLALLPVGACPACWPAYAGLLGSLGLGFLLKTSDLLPVTGGFLTAALLPLGYRARERHGLGPLGLGMAATGTALLGKFAFGSSAILYLGLALLIGASIWNTRPLAAARTGTCGKCATPVSGSNESGAANTKTRRTRC
jgi:hypothetical protein